MAKVGDVFDTGIIVYISIERSKTKNLEKYISFPCWLVFLLPFLNFSSLVNVVVQWLGIRYDVKKKGIGCTFVITVAFHNHSASYNRKSYFSFSQHSFT